MSRKISLAATSAAAIVAVGGLALGVGGTAHASVEFTCSAGTTCFFSDDNYQTVATVVSNSAYPNQTSFSSLGIADPGSVNVDGNSSLHLLGKSTGETACIPGGKAVLDHTFGYFYIDYGVKDC